MKPKATTPGWQHDLQSKTDSLDIQQVKVERCYFVSCVGKKQRIPAAAKDLYTSVWFNKARQHVERTGLPWFILSAEYGLVAPEQIILPYEKTLNTMPIAARKSWAEIVLQQLTEVAPKLQWATFLAGARYREFLAPRLQSRNVVVEVPMEGLGIGKQLSWLGTKHG